MNKRQKNKPSSDNEPNNNFLGLFKAAGCGICMGMADVVPGVSGGTVALVLGIYQRLVTAISKVDREFLGYIRRFEFAAAARHIDLAFLMSLAVGLATGFILTVLTISKLLESESARPFVQACFFGLILGAAWIVYQMIRSRETQNQLSWIATIVGFVIASAICWISPGNLQGDPALWYVFLCGVVAICAMILPGISGALILLLLGCYGYMVDAIKSVIHFENLATNLPVAIVFSSGCLIGLLGFSKILRRLLENKPAVTLSMLCGLMLGSLFKLWPYQTDLSPEAEEFKHKIFQPSWPTAIDGKFFAYLLTIVIAAAAIIILERIASRLNSRSA